MEEGNKIKTPYEIALQESETEKPSADPAYWAKKSCNRCYGRGIVGKMETLVDSNKIVQSLLCECSRRRFSKWREAWIQEYLSKPLTPAVAPVTAPAEPVSVVDNL